MIFLNNINKQPDEIYNVVWDMYTVKSELQQSYTAIIFISGENIELWLLHSAMICSDGDSD